MFFKQYQLGCLSLYSYLIGDEHTGRAVVFDSYPDMKARIDDPASGITPDDVLVLRNAGPLGGPGMPEWGMLPMPKPKNIIEAMPKKSGS